MCRTPAGLWHFLSVYHTAYPPQDYRREKRAKAGAPSHPLLHFFFFTKKTLVRTHANLKKKKKNVIHLQMHSRPSMFPTEERERKRRGRDEETEENKAQYIPVWDMAEVKLSAVYSRSGKSADSCPLLDILKVCLYLLLFFCWYNQNVLEHFVQACKLRPAISDSPSSS